MRKLTFALMLALLFGFAAAQTVTPTDGTGDDDANAGTTQAEVQQTVTLKLPKATALHITANDLVFDIADINSTDGTGSEMVCVFGSDYSPASTPIGTRGVQQKPLGTHYLPDGDWTNSSTPTIKIMDHGGVVQHYPPYEIKSGELVTGSKKYFVCYKTFILQKFSNAGNWDLTVARDGGTYDMWIQDNSICSFNDPGAGGTNGNGQTGLFILDTTNPVNLLPNNYTNNTTGSYSELCSDAMDKSWLDDLVVVAVKVNGETAGEHDATLTYTLTSNFPQPGN